MNNEIVEPSLRRRGSVPTFQKATLLNTAELRDRNFTMFQRSLSNTQKPSSAGEFMSRRTSVPQLTKLDNLRPVLVPPQPFRLQSQETTSSLDHLSPLKGNLSSARLAPPQPGQKNSSAKGVSKWLLLYESWKVERRLILEQSQSLGLVEELSLPKRVSLYQIQGELGVGNFSKVRLGRHLLTKTRVAVKVLDRTHLGDRTARILSREIDIMERLHHPHIVRLYEACELHTRTFLFLEYAPLGELNSRVLRCGKYPEFEAKLLFVQVLSALKHMHERNIFHRDLKAENIFLMRERFVKLGDFGFSTLVENPHAALLTFCGSPPYASPELFVSDSYEGAGVDLWALGVLAYFLLTGILPFRADSVSKLKRLILRGRYKMPEFLSDSCKEVIGGLLTVEVSRRWTLPELLGSEWFEDFELAPAFPWYEMIPREFTASSGIGGRASQLKPERAEQEAEHLMRQWGIQPEELKKVRRYGPQHPLTGVYRIVHREIHERNARRDDDEEDDLQDNNEEEQLEEEEYDGLKPAEVHRRAQKSHFERGTGEDSGFKDREKPSSAHSTTDSTGSAPIQSSRTCALL